MRENLTEKIRRIIDSHGGDSTLVESLRTIIGEANEFEVLTAGADELRRRGEFAQALEVYEYLLSRIRRDGVQEAVILNNIAALHETTGSYQEAEMLYRRSLELSERALGPEHPTTVTTLSNLAAVLEATGRYQEAEMLYRRSLELSERVLGPQHPTTATTLNNLAAVLEATGRFQEAEVLYHRSLEIAERLLGGRHPSVARILNNMAGLAAKNQNYYLAEQLMSRAVHIMTEALGSDSEYTRIGLANLETIRAEQRHAADARASRR